MEVNIKHQPSYALAVVTLAPNEQIRAEPGAMVSYTEGVETDTKVQGGILSGFKRMLAGEDFFQNLWKAPSQGGEITFAPALPGDMISLEIQGEFLLQSGAYVASESSVEMDAKWGGSKGFFGSGNLILLKMSGRGKFIAASYGAIEQRTLQAGEKYYVDTGHIVGFDASISFNVKKVGSWKSTILGGEGLVCELKGPGRLWLQSRSEEALVSWLIPKMPKPSSGS